MPNHNTLIVETGARGHVLADTIRRTSDVAELYHYPDKVLAQEEGLTLSTGLPSLSELGGWEDAKPTLVDFALSKEVNLVLVTADDPIATGVGDAFREAGIQTFSPTAEAATIESSKVKMKDLAKKLGVPTANYETFQISDTDQTIEEIITYAAELKKFQIVIKADCLATGKGVAICKDAEDLVAQLQHFKANNLLRSGESVVVEEFLDGPEISLHAWVDGDNYIMFPFAMQDHKTIRENDEGPMTGGMGVVMPMPHITPQDIERLGKVFFKPFIRALKEEGNPFQGVMYPSIKLTPDGPKLLEINSRFGDPEAPACLPMLESDIVQIAKACAEGKLHEIPTPRWRKGAAVCIALATPGYPGKAQTGGVIQGIEEARQHREVRIYDYAVKAEPTPFGPAVLKTNGGRVLGVHASAPNMAYALGAAKKAAKEIRFDGNSPQMRGDIGERAVSDFFKERVETMRHYLAA